MSATERIRRIRVVVEERAEDEHEEPKEGDSEAIDRILKGYKEKIKSPSTAIRSFCVHCMGGYVRMVAKCTAHDCSLYPFRFGTNPMHGRVGQKNPNAGKRLRSGKRG